MTSGDEPRPEKRPTLEDVAARAGVSRALVSIVMRGARGASEQTRQRVRQVADEMGYRPDARARLLASETSSPLIGVVFSSIGVFHYRLLDGLYAAAEQAGCGIILSALTAHRDERRAVETLLDFRCDAAILMGPETRSPPVLAGRLPVVVIGWTVDDDSVDVVRTSDAVGSEQIIDHLVGLGHRSIVHIDGGGGVVSVARRQEYRRRMRQHGLSANIRVVRGGWHQQHGVTAAREIMQMDPVPTAVVAFNDEVAAGLREAFFQAGIAVPDDVSIVGWDDSPLARLPYLSLTTIRQNPDELARLALERSITRIGRFSVTEREIVLAPILVIRNSTGPARHGPLANVS